MSFTENLLNSKYEGIWNFLWKESQNQENVKSQCSVINIAERYVQGTVLRIKKLVCPRRGTLGAEPGRAGGGLPGGEV